ncbi:golgin subfamily A member 6-like protein 22 [Macrosteles quadrilineatus]|uniref:golgin subfamily A member 6-like protein 22 n=1 Tax=Macrosteles quadrilineatus TaxID=74068 RepID=UPI0023E3017D|nr:golgin subfamily A member 6-like protein 22 [Macrosteles quadrilineatus]
MDRQNRDRDSATEGRTLHTYTPKSHEDLLRSHLQLDATRNARLQNELKRLADENKKLQQDLEDAQNEIYDKEDEIEELRRKLEEKPKYNPSSKYSPDEPEQVFEIDGKPVTLEQILMHFEGVIEKHHDLLDNKNRQIFDLENALKNMPKQAFKSTRNIETQLEPSRENREDFTRELVLIRKEYEQVEHILTDRNNKLENHIEDLHRKLDQYNNEIGHLRRELAAQRVNPKESPLLLKEKEKENSFARNVAYTEENQPQISDVVSKTNEPIKPYETAYNEKDQHEEPNNSYEKAITTHEEPIPRYEKAIITHEDPMPRYERAITTHEDPIMVQPGYGEQNIHNSPDSSSLKSFKLVDYRPVSPEISYRQFPIRSERYSKAHDPRSYSPPACEACGENYIPSRAPYIQQQDDVPSRAEYVEQQQLVQGKPKKKGCCGGKGSQTSNVPYEKRPQKEQVVHVHNLNQAQDQPSDSPKPKRKLVAKLKPDIIKL